ncbi:MAG: phosphotransferase, partial [Lautropia sp.]
MNQSRCNSPSEQAGTLAFLQDELARRDPGMAVQVLETHISVILLSAKRAWKLKKAVTLPYLDFASAQTRLALCQRELELNRRTAPAIYRAVHRVIRRAGGDLSLVVVASAQTPGGDVFAGGGGIDADDGTTLVDAVLEMERFEQDQLLDRLAVDGALSPQLVTRLAQAIAKLHKQAQPLLQAERSGSQRIGDILEINERGLARAGGLLDVATVRRVTQTLRLRWRQHDGLLDQRQHAGHVRRCHGDLHLSNIVVIDGVPTLFDCLEFDEGMATTDVLYDLAFVL